MAPWGTDPPTWVHYSNEPKPPGTQINYWVQPASADPPPGTTHVSTETGVAVYVRDKEVRKPLERPLRIAYSRDLGVF